MTRKVRRFVLQATLVCLVFNLAYLAYASGDPFPTAAPAVPPRPSPPLPDRDGPVLTPDSEEHDFGPVEPGSQARHVFVLRNEGGRELVISDVSASCGCTATVLDRTVVPPEEEARVEVVFTAGRRTGRFTNRITIVSNAPDSPRRLAVTGTVKPLARLDPEIIVADGLSRDAPRTVTLTVSPARDGLALRLHDPRSTAPGVTVSEPRPIDLPAPGSYRLEVTIDPSGFTGSTTNGSVVVETGLEAAPTLTVQVIARVKTPGR